MTKLDEFLDIPELVERIEALIDYARTLNIDVVQAKNSRGGYSEEKLAILIFDAENNVQHERTHTSHLLSATIIMGTAIFALMFLLPKIVASVYTEEKRINPPPPTTLKGYTKKGKPIIENDQPVLFELMDGTYQEFNDDGQLQYEYEYKEGTLLKKTHYDEHSQIIDVQTFKEQNAKTQ